MRRRALQRRPLYDSSALLGRSLRTGQLAVCDKTGGSWT
jgi:hypothetical protein